MLIVSHRQSAFKRWYCLRGIKIYGADTRLIPTDTHSDITDPTPGPHTLEKLWWKDGRTRDVPNTRHRWNPVYGLILNCSWMTGKCLQIFSVRSETDAQALCLFPWKQMPLNNRNLRNEYFHLIYFLEMTNAVLWCWLWPGWLNKHEPNPCIQI